MNLNWSAQSGGQRARHYARRRYGRRAQCAGRDDQRPGRGFRALVGQRPGLRHERRDQARAFEPFFTTKDIGKGSGLGLPQVHGFATQSGGTVRIESQLGEGTTVNLLLRRSAITPQSAPVHPIDLHEAAAEGQGRGNVLLVDDDEVAALVEEMLGRLGFDVIRTASGAAALGALANGRSVDLVFSDITMPGALTGSIWREIRERHPQLPVLLTSGYAEGVHVLPKPYHLDELTVAIGQLTAPNAAPCVSRRADQTGSL